MTTTSDEPLTPKEQEQLDALTARREAAERREAQERRAAQREGLKPVQALAKVLTKESFLRQIDEVIDDPAVELETRTRLRTLRQTIDFALQPLRAMELALG